MRNNHKVLIVFSLALLVATSAMSFVLLNPPRRWFDTPRNVTVDQQGMASVTDSDNGVAESLVAVTEWNGSGVNVTSSSSGNVGPTLGDGISELAFDDPFNVCTGSCLAATFTGFFDDGQTGDCGGLSVVAITDSDVVFNTRFDFTSQSEPDGCSSEIFIEPVVTHEVGHLIGLGHSQNGDALMAPSISTCVFKPLHADDIDGRNALYDCNLVEDPGGGQCTLGQPGESCSVDSDCCSGSCTRGRPSTRVCN